MIRIMRYTALAALMVSLLAPAQLSAQSQTTDTRAALKEVGMAVLPEFLDAATEHITIRMPAALGGEKLVFGGTGTTSDTGTGTTSNPFGS